MSYNESGPRRATDESDADTEVTGAVCEVLTCERRLAPGTASELQPPREGLFDYTQSTDEETKVKRSQVGEELELNLRFIQGARSAPTLY